MDVFDAIKTRLEVRNYSSEPVPREILKEILEAGRLSPSGLNSQHWRFIIVEDRKDLAELAEISTSGKWVAGAAFAVVVLTNPKYPWHLIDAGRAVTQMQLAAWNKGVGSCIYTGYDEKAMRQRLNIPENYHIACVVGFGYPQRRILGRKRRLPLESIAYSGQMGVTFKP
ncbi:MAG: nitroreductase family protein [Candidatus Caldarchaeum sp.]|nr:nitroreductase family protein [Candidatus Caldarchaeum sp.]